MTIDYKKTKYHTLALYSPYDPALVNKLREFQSTVGWQSFNWDSSIKAWVFSPEILDKVIYEFRPDVKDSAMSEYEKWKTKQNAEQQLKKEAMKDVEVQGLPLFDYQKKGVAFASAYPKVMIADEMGLGKSIQALGVIKNLQLEKVLIVCPASLKSNWLNEIKKWDIGEAAIYGDWWDAEWRTTEEWTFLQSIKTPWVLIINYEQLQKLDNSNWDLIIFDESHYLKNPKTKRTKEAMRIAKNAKRVILLTGTPILNRPVELVPQIEILGQMERFKSSWNFMQKYCDAKQNNWGWDFSGASNLDELKTHLNEFVIRRTKAEVLTDLPNKLVHSTYLDMPEPEAYEKVKKEVQKELVTTKEEYRDFYKMLSGMSEIQRATYLDGLQHNEKYKQLSANILTTIEKLKQEAARQKLLLLPEILEQYGDEKVLIFCTHKSIANQMQEEMPNDCWGITGDLHVSKRQITVNEFQNGRFKYLVGTIATMGVGFNITNCSNVIFLELGWTPALHQQAEDRCYRIGQKNNVNVNYLILKDSIDEDIVELLMNKTEVIEGTVKGKVLAKILKNNLTFDDNPNLFN